MKTNPTLKLSGLFIGPLVHQIERWLEAGKLDDEDLDRELTPNARSLVDAPSVSTAWIPLEDAESLVAVVADQLGGEAGLVELADAVVGGLAREERIACLLEGADRLVDAAGYVITQTSERLLREASFRYQGGRDRFCVRILGLTSMSSDLKALLGALLAKLAQRLDDGFDDVRVDGVDGPELLVFGERTAHDRIDSSSRTRLHRAALVP